MKGTTNSQRGAGGGGEKLVISLKTNQASHEDLLGAKFSVVINGNATEYTWQGVSMTIPIPSMLNYTDEFGEVEGYAKPESVTHTAVAGNDRFVTGTYNSELVTVNVSANEGSVSGYEVTIAKVNKYGSNNEYTEVEYIESNGNQYINTGVIPSSDKIRVVVDFLYTATPSSKVVFGCQHNSETSRYGLICYNSPASIYVGSSAALLPKTISLNTRYVLDAEADNGALNVSWNGSKTSTSYSGTIYKGYSFYLFGNNRENSVNQMSSIKMHSCQIYDNDILVRDYNPVIDSNGVAGLYDKINNVFYPSNSSTEFVAGDKVGEVIAMQTTPSASYKIPYGTSYTIKANDISGYTTPSEQSFTASQPSRNVDVCYEEILYGVYIQGVSGKLYKKNSWKEQEEINGIAILSGDNNFVICLDNIYNPSRKNYETIWSDTYSKVVGICTTTSSNIAIQDFDGERNTLEITEFYLDQSEFYSAQLARNFIFPNGQSGYLGSAGEWQIVFDNVEQVNEALNICGRESLSSFYWTSTQYDDSYAWYMKFMNNMGLQFQTKVSWHLTRAFLNLSI